MIGAGAGNVIAAGQTDTDGTVCIGYNSGNDITNGQYSTFVGYSSGNKMTTGDSNTAFGYEAFGASAAAANTGDANTVVGYRAGYDLQGAANNNTLVGSTAGTAITTGVNNTFVGGGAGDVATTINNSVAIGSSAIGGAIGAQALEHVVAIGVDAFLGTSSTTTGPNGLVAIGSYAGRALTTGANNTFVGYNSGYGVTVGSANTFFGRHTGNNMDSGSSNVLVGYTAGQYTCLLYTSDAADE